MRQGSQHHHRLSRIRLLGILDGGEIGLIGRFNLLLSGTDNQHAELINGQRESQSFLRELAHLGARLTQAPDGAPHARDNGLAQQTSPIGSAASVPYEPAPAAR